MIKISKGDVIIKKEKKTFKARERFNKTLIFHGLIKAQNVWLDHIFEHRSKTCLVSIDFDSDEIKRCSSVGYKFTFNFRISDKKDGVFLDIL